METTCDAGDACFIHSGGALLLNEASALSSHTDEERQQQTCGLPRRLANKDLCWTRLPLSDYGPFTLSALTSPWVREAVSSFLLFLLFLDLYPKEPPRLPPPPPVWKCPCAAAFLPFALFPRALWRGCGGVVRCIMLPWLLLLFLPLLLPFFGLKSRKSMLTRRDRDMMRARTHTDYFAGRNPPPHLTHPSPFLFFYPEGTALCFDLRRQEEIKIHVRPSHARLYCYTGRLPGIINCFNS